MAKTSDKETHRTVRVTREAGQMLDLMQGLISLRTGKKPTVTDLLTELVTAKFNELMPEGADQLGASLDKQTPPKS